MPTRRPGAGTNGSRDRIQGVVAAPESVEGRAALWKRYNKQESGNHGGNGCAGTQPSVPSRSRDDAELRSFLEDRFAEFEGVLSGSSKVPAASPTARNAPVSPKRQARRGVPAPKQCPRGTNDPEGTQPSVRHDKNGTKA